MNSTEENRISDRTNTVAALMMATNSLLGLFLNITFMYNFFAHKQQKSSFNLTCGVRAFNNSFILLVAFLGIFLPTTIIGHNFLPPILESLLISISLNCNIHNEVQGVFMAVNRFFAMFFTSKYNKVFSKKMTVFSHLAIASIQIYEVVDRIIWRYRTSTFLVYNVRILAYGGLVDSTAKMSYYAIGYFLITFFINLPTFFRCYYLKKTLSPTDSTESGQQVRRYVTEFVQTVFQDSIWQISFLFNMKFNTLINNRIWYFFCQTFIWQCLHVLDGFVMVMYNERLAMYRRALLSKMSPGNSWERYRNRHNNAVAPAGNVL